MFDNISEDLNRYFTLSNPKNFFGKLKVIVFTQGIWATTIYRMGSWCVKKGIIGRIFLPFLTVCQKVIEIVTGISLPFTAKIGKGLYIGHFGGIIVGHEAVLGEYCNISQGVTIGQAGRGGRQFTPLIGNRVYFAPGAKTFGNIRIGDNVAIGANAVVLDNVRNEAVVAGIPAIVINYNGSSDFIIVSKKKNE